MSGWFPNIRMDGEIASGDSGIVLTPLVGPPVPFSPTGLRPVWCGRALVFNNNDGTSPVGTGLPESPWKPVPAAYSEYVGSDDGQWAGFWAPDGGHVQRYRFTTKVGQPILTACFPQFYGASFGYLAPYQAVPPDYPRDLIIDGFPALSQKPIVRWAANLDGNGYVCTIASSQFGRRLRDHVGNDITIRSQEDETAMVVFTGPDDWPWIVSQTTNSGTFVRMSRSALGHVIPGILNDPAARMIGNRLLVAGSDHGNLRTVWIDFSAPRVDLRLA